MEKTFFSFASTNFLMLIRSQKALLKHYKIKSKFKKFKIIKEINQELKKWHERIKKKEKLPLYQLRVYGVFNLRKLNEVFSNLILLEKKRKIERYIKNINHVKYKIAYPELFEEAIKLHQQGFGFKRASKKIRDKFGIIIPDSTLRNWFYSKHHRKDYLKMLKKLNKTSTFVK